MKTKIHSPLRYPGGKFYAIKHINKFWEKVEHDEFREPFSGGASVFFAKPKVEFNWLNDIDKRILQMFTIIQDKVKREILIEKLLKEQDITKKRHLEVKEFKPKGDIETAFKYYFLNRTSYSGIIHKPAWGFKIGHSALPPTWAVRIRNAGNKLESVQLTSDDFKDCILLPGKGNKVLLYVDPPYYLADQKRAYQHSFTEKDHIRLAKVLKKTKHKFFLSYDDCDEVRKLYDWAYIYEESWWYNIANCSGTNSRKKGNELVITNYPMTPDSKKVSKSI